MTTVGILLAAGSGKRMQAGRNKLFLTLQGQPVLVHTVQAFQQCPFVDGLVVVAKKEELEAVQRLLPVTVYDKILCFTAGGKERQDSVFCGLQALPTDCGRVLIHDGARPFVRDELVERLLKAVDVGCGAIAAVPAKDTIKRVDEHGYVRETLLRSELWNVQTPQCFNVADIRRCHQLARQEGYYGTDDASLAERYGMQVRIVPAYYENIKLTTPEDLLVAESFLQHASNFGGNHDVLVNDMTTNGISVKYTKKGEKTMRVGFGYDVHQLVEARKLILGGVEIPYERGLLGHSDADVLVHALMDALLGAAAMGDIGRHFPDNDDQYKGISSMVLLERVVQLLDTAEYAVNNVDVTVVAQRPKLASYIPKMEEHIAQVLRLDVTAVNIKATTTERLGFEGEGLGISAYAVCTLKQKEKQEGKQKDFA